MVATDWARFETFWVLCVHISGATQNKPTRRIIKPIKQFDSIRYYCTVEIDA